MLMSEWKISKKKKKNILSSWQGFVSCFQAPIDNMKRWLVDWISVDDKARLGSVEALVGAH